MSDGKAPQDAGFPCLGVLRRQLADQAGGLHQGCFVVEVGQRQWYSPHQRAMTRSPAGEFVQPSRFLTRRLSGDTPSSRSAEHRPGLYAYVFGVMRPVMPPLGDGVERLFIP